MKITKSQLKQIIKEELEVTLTNEEAGDMFGEAVEEQLEEQELNEDMDTLMQNLTPENLDLLWRALVKMGTTIGLPVLAGFLGRLGYEAAATALAKDPMERGEKNWLVNFIYDEATGYKDYKGPTPKAPKGPPPGTVIPMGKDINRDNLDEEASVAGDVARAGEKLGKASGIEAALANINTRPEFEQMMMKFIQMVSATKLKPQDVKTGVRNVAKQILQAK